jgi:predicted dehydrogenase
MPRPRILIVGAGKFGREHLAEWRRLAAEGEAEVAGIVVQTEASRAARQAAQDIPVHCGLTSALLASVDAVDIVTPSASHAELVRRSLPHAHVFVEKPLALVPAEAAELKALAASSGRVLMVGHLFRYHPVVRELKRVIGTILERPSGIDGVMTNPKAELSTRTPTRTWSSCTSSTSSTFSSASSRR